MLIKDMGMGNDSWIRINDKAMGTVIECKRLNKLEEAITRSDNVQGTLSYCIYVSHSFVNLREYRHESIGRGILFWQAMIHPAIHCLLLSMSSGIKGISFQPIH